MTHRPLMGCICATYEYNPRHAMKDKETDGRTNGMKPILTHTHTTSLCVGGIIIIYDVTPMLLLAEMS